MDDMADIVARAEARVLRSEALVRSRVRHVVGADMTAEALRLAMRDMTPDSYRQSVLKDHASRLAIQAGWR